MVFNNWPISGGILSNLKSESTILTVSVSQKSSKIDEAVFFWEQPIKYQLTKQGLFFPFIAGLFVVFSNHNKIPNPLKRNKAKNKYG